MTESGFDQVRLGRQILISPALHFLKDHSKNCTDNGFNWGKSESHSGGYWNKQGGLENGGNKREGQNREARYI